MEGAKSMDSGSGFYRRRGWGVDLFEVGDPLSCVFSCCCAPCALAASRSALDNSSPVFNLICLPVCCLPTSRWLLRSAYDIEGSCEEDCVVSLLFPCCIINQLYQTSLMYGTDGIDGGAYANDKTFHANEGACCCRDDISEIHNNYYDGALCCYSYICCPCATGEAMHDSVGMPWIMGACCVTPCASRNLLRYHYRIGGDDLLEELALPTVVSLLLYGISANILAPLVVPGLMLPQVYIESKYRGKSDSTRYLRTTEAFAWAHYPRSSSRAASHSDYSSEVRGEERQRLLGVFTAPTASSNSANGRGTGAGAGADADADAHSNSARFGGLPILARLRLPWSGSKDAGEAQSDEGSIPSLTSDVTKNSWALSAPPLDTLGGADYDDRPVKLRGNGVDVNGDGDGDGDGGKDALSAWGSAWGSSAKKRREEREKTVCEHPPPSIPVAHDVGLAQRWHENLQRAESSYQISANLAES